MRIYSQTTLRNHWRLPSRQDSEEPLKAWYDFVRQARWTKPADVKTDFVAASILANNRVVFNVAGNKYRLIVSIAYRARPPTVFVKFVGTHREYDRIDAVTYRQTDAERE